jgi:hypothetical protein
MKMESKEVKGLMQAYASIYEGYGKDKDKKKKKMHDCATHGEHSEWGAGLMIKEMHTLDEDGNVTHYDVMFEHGIEKNVPVEELNITMSERHEHFINYDKNAEVLGESDIFDAILEHLVAEGYADTNKAALAIMANMSEEWKQSIVEKHATFGYNAEDPLDDFEQFVDKGPKTNKQKRNAIELNNKILSKPGMPVKGV